MSAWEKFVYQLARAFWSAFFDMLAGRGAVVEEVPNEGDIDGTRKLRVLVRRVQDGAAARPDGGAPSS